MATLALNVVGTALGGPIGGAIGSLIGQGIDRSLFGPGPRQGPRINDLKVQVSSYGSQIPRLYGTMRVAGTVIWATDLQETSEIVGDAVVYSYSVSFAVALSSRSAKGIGRIWADGTLLRGAAGDFKVKTGFRFYSGDEDQIEDPLIASIEGLDSAPAYRGLALALFEDLQLAGFGGRIPALTFELFGDDAVPTLGAIINDVSGETIDCAAVDPVGGYAAYGSSRKSAIAPLVAQFVIPLSDDGVRFGTPNAAPAILASSDELGCGPGDSAVPGREMSQIPAGELPRALSLTYYDATRDFQTSQMRATGVLAGGTEEAVELPAVLSAEQAKALAETNLARRWTERGRLVLRLPPDRLAAQPGQFVRLEDGSVWGVDAVAIEEFVVRLELSRQLGTMVNVPADAGRHVPAADLVAKPTVIAILDLPDLGIGRHDVPTLHVAACQAGAKWRPISIEVTNGGDVWTISSAPAEATIGVTLTALGEGASIDVELADPDQWLESRDEGALANGANLAAIGRELVQFATATSIGSQRVRLSGLVRGCFGTEWAMSNHSAGETFVFIDANALQEVVLPRAAIGTAASIVALGLADQNALPVECLASGEAMMPPSPTDLVGQKLADGSLSLSWTRRSRLGWTWPSTSEPPLGESTEKYIVTVAGSAESLTFEALQPQLVVPSGALAGMTGTVTIEVVQVGDFASSRPARLTIED